MTSIEVKTDPWEPALYRIHVRRPDQRCKHAFPDVAYKPGTGIYCMTCGFTILGISL